MDFFGITGLHVEAQGIGSVILPSAGIYAPNATSEYQAFVDEVNNALFEYHQLHLQSLWGISTKGAETRGGGWGYIPPIIWVYPPQ